MKKINFSYSKLKETYLYFIGGTGIWILISQINEDLSYHIWNNSMLLTMVGLTLLGCLLTLITMYIKVINTTFDSAKMKYKLKQRFLIKILLWISASFLIGTGLGYIIFCPSIFYFKSCHGFINGTAFMAHDINPNGFMILLLAGISFIGTLFIRTYECIYPQVLDEL